MGKKINFWIRKYSVFAVLFFFPLSGIAQTAAPDILNNGTLKEQYNYIQEKTRIYEEYRAVREDMFQKIKSNSLDSVRASRAEIDMLRTGERVRNTKIDSLNASIETFKSDLEKVTKSKNSILFFGIEVSKGAYNAILWTIVAGLAFLLIIGFMAYKRNYTVTSQTKKEYEDLKREFEAYRKASREAREKMSMAHFNELKRLRGA